MLTKLQIYCFSLQLKTFFYLPSLPVILVSQKRAKSHRLELNSSLLSWIVTCSLVTFSFGLGIVYWTMIIYWGWISPRKHIKLVTLVCSSASAFFFINVPILLLSLAIHASSILSACNDFIRLETEFSLRKGKNITHFGDNT